MNHSLKWVKVEKYCEISGDSYESVQSRRKAGKWLDGVHCKIVDGRVWVNLEAAEKWVEEWQPNRQLRVA